MKAFRGRRGSRLSPANFRSLASDRTEFNLQVAAATLKRELRTLFFFLAPELRSGVEFGMSYHHSY
jgi:hypothetical protein